MAAATSLAISREVAAISPCAITRVTGWRCEGSTFAWGSICKADSGIGLHSLRDQRFGAREVFRRVDIEERIQRFGGKFHADIRKTVDQMIHFANSACAQHLVRIERQIGAPGGNDGMVARRAGSNGDRHIAMFSALYQTADHIRGQERAVAGAAYQPMRVGPVVLCPLQTGENSGEWTREICNSISDHGAAECAEP